MRIAVAILLIPFSVHAANLTGNVVDPTGASIARADVELDSGTKKYQVRTDAGGVYQFSGLPPGEYNLRFTAEAIRPLTVQSVELSENKSKRIPEITLIRDLLCRSSPVRFVRMTPESLSGELSGSVLPPAPGVEVFLICRTFRPCGSTKTDSSRRFSFQKLTAGAYGLSFHRNGFFDQDAAGYEYYVNAGLESIYAAVRLEPCPNSNCEAKIQRILPLCQ